MTPNRKKMAKTAIVAMRIATMVVLVGSMAGIFALSVMPGAPVYAIETPHLGAIASSATVTGPLSFTSNGAVQAYPHTSGSGTPDNPYVIENMIVCTTTSTPGLTFQTVTAHVVVKNSLIYSTVSAGDGVVINNCANVTLQDCKVIGFQNGLLVMGSSNVAILGNTIGTTAIGIQLVGSTTKTLVGENVISAMNAGIYINGVWKSTIRGNWIYNASVGGYNAGVVLASTCSSNLFIGNHIESCMYGFLVLTNSQANRFSFNTIVRCGNGFNLVGANGGTIEGNRITNMTQYGICMLTGTTNMTITGNTIEACAGLGVCTDSTTYCWIQYNLIRFCTAPGIILNPGSDGHHIVGNVLVCATCIVVQSNGNTVVGNDFITSSTEISVSGTPTGNAYDEDGLGNYYDQYTVVYPAASKSADGKTWLTEWTHNAGVSDGHPLVNHADSDGDGLTNYQELLTYRTLANDADSDDDGANDGAEIEAGSDPYKADTDGDGATDGDELRAGTDPLNGLEYPWFGFKPVIFIALFVGIPVVAIRAGAIAIKYKRAKGKHSRAKASNTTKSQATSPKKSK